MTSADLARRCHVRRGTIYLLMIGRKTSMRGLHALVAEALDLKPSVVHAAIMESRRRAASAADPDRPLVAPSHLSELRAMRGMTQLKLAKKSGVVEMTISGIENGNKPHSATIYAIAHGLKMSFDVVRLACCGPQQQSTP